MRELISVRGLGGMNAAALSFSGKVQMIRGVTSDRGDVVVLGAGLTGFSASLAFARSGRRVLLLERDGPGPVGDADRLFE